MSTSKQTSIVCGNGVADDARAAVNIAPLPNGASLQQREAYIKEHVGAESRCRRLELRHYFCIGVELMKIKTAKKLQGPNWDAYCRTTFGFTPRQAQDYTALPRGFGSMEKMLEIVASPASLTLAADTARAWPGSKIKPSANSKIAMGRQMRVGGNGAATKLGPERGDDAGSPPTLAPPVAMPDRGREVADLVDDIQRITGQMGDQHLGLLRRVHRLLTGSRKGRSESKGNAKRRKTK